MNSYVVARHICSLRNKKKKLVYKLSPKIGVIWSLAKRSAYRFVLLHTAFRVLLMQKLISDAYMNFENIVSQLNDVNGNE